MSKLTAMQELIDSFEKFKGMCQTDGEKFIINYVINNSKLRLEKEKQQIIEAVTFGNRQDFYDGNEEMGINYYDTNFNNK